MHQETKVSRKRDSSSNASEHIVLYTTPSVDEARDEAIPAVQQIENVKPSATGDATPHIEFDSVLKLRRITSPLHANQLGAKACNRFGLPLPDMGFVRFDTSPFLAVENHPQSPSESSNYPSEGIRSEECLSPPDTANTDIHQSDFNLSDLAQYWYGSGRERMSEWRSTSLTDGDGPHMRNVSTNLEDELAAADSGGITYGSETADDADRSSDGSSSRTSSETVVGQVPTINDVPERKGNLEALSRVTADETFVQRSSVEDASTTRCSTNGAEKSDEPKAGKSHNRFKIRKWVKRTWGKTKGRSFLKDVKENWQKHGWATAQ
jgi:hypothetical protein